MMYRLVANKIRIPIDSSLFKNFLLRQECFVYEELYANLKKMLNRKFDEFVTDLISFLFI